MNTDLIMILAIFTLGAGLLWGVLSWLRAKSAQDHHEDAAVAQRQRTEDPEAPAEGTRPTFSETDHTNRNWSEERGANPPTPMPPRN